MESLVMQNILSLFEGKRVLVTGDTGFKGSWLSLWLRELGADVVGYALPPERDDDLFNLLGLEQIIHHVEGDIRDLPAIQQVFKWFQPEVLFHLAAQSLVRRSYSEPQRTFDTNVQGSVNVLEAVRTTRSLRVVVYVTTDKCYQNREWVWGYRENDELGGRDPYSASKAAAELVFSAYSASFFTHREGIGAASVRAGNVLGGGDRALDRIVPDSLKALKNGEPVILRNPCATRPWQHVLEPLSGYLLLAVKLYESPKDFSGAWNFGPTGESIRTVRDLTEKILAYWGDGIIRVETQTSGPYEADFLHLNCDKARRLLEWNPKWDFERTVAETVRWYKCVDFGESALALTREQILDYMVAKND
ncbi:CDP-glucose 4,6-dehydratase [Nitrospiraceae bacterium AH_259_D15_M11_P09]|nr:CDP-glucose 4,6-dehydratase [Nitrospiraceae bacterium AH_259_D15_M11_P09]